MTANLTTCERCGKPHDRCAGHRKSDGAPCTSHPVLGTSVCWKHGGAAYQTQAAGRRRVAQAQLSEAAARFGLPRDVDPAEAIVEAIHKAAGQVDFFESEVLRLGSPWVEQVGPGGSTRIEEHPAVTAFRASLDRLFGYSSKAVGLGLAERVVAVEEQSAMMLAAAMMALLDDSELGLSREQRELGRRIAGRHLRALEPARPA